jgi:hypothetical protein
VCERGNAVHRRDFLTRTLAALGTILAWLTLLAPVLASLAAFFGTGLARFDYLMPAELFPAAFVGGGLLLWAAMRAGAHVKLVAWGLGIAAVSLAGGQGLAVLTGLASGATEPTGWPWLFVLASLGLYALGVMMVAIAGVLLVRDLFGRSVRVG